MAVINDPTKTELGSGWSITQLGDKSGTYYRIAGPNGECRLAWEEYTARMYAKDMGWVEG